MITIDLTQREYEAIKKSWLRTDESWYLGLMEWVQSETGCILQGRSELTMTLSHKNTEGITLALLKLV